MLTDKIIISQQSQITGNWKSTLYKIILEILNWNSYLKHYAKYKKYWYKFILPTLCLLLIEQYIKLHCRSVAIIYAWLIYFFWKDYHSWMKDNCQGDNIPFLHLIQFNKKYGKQSELVSKFNYLPCSWRPE